MYYVIVWFNHLLHSVDQLENIAFIIYLYIFQRAGNWVTPVVGLCENIDLDKLTLNKSEVCTNIIIPFLHTTNQQQMTFKTSGQICEKLP